MTRVHYYPSFPFGDLHFALLKKQLPRITWALSEGDIALLDSNAPQRVETVQEQKVLAVNPIIQRNKQSQKMPIYLKSPFLTKALLKRSLKYKLDVFLDSYAYPNKISQEFKSEAKKILSNYDIWKEILLSKYKVRDQSKVFVDKTVFVLNNPEDPLRSAENLSYASKTIKYQAPHGLLAYSENDWLTLNSLLQDLSQI